MRKVYYKNNNAISQQKCIEQMCFGAHTCRSGILNQARPPLKPPGLHSSGQNQYRVIPYKVSTSTTLSSILTED